MKKRNHRRTLNVNKRRHPLTAAQACTKCVRRANRTYFRKFNRLIYLLNRGLKLDTEAQDLRAYIVTHDPVLRGT